MRKVFLVLLVVLGSCSGTAHQITIGSPPSKQTTGTLAGALCSGAKCTCRTGAADGGVGVPEDPAHKRYEIRLGPSPQELWVSYPGGVLYKSAERVEECFYVDFSTGDHPIELRASNSDGVSMAFSIKELGTKTKSWYDTFRWNCGSPGVCSFSEMDTMKSEQSLIKRNLRDPCGSTKVKSVTWDQSKAPDGEHPSDVVVRLTLGIYKFTPWRATGEECGEGGGRAPNENPDAGGAAADPAPQSGP